MARSITLLLVFVLGACKTTPVAGECPDSSRVPCLTRRICTEDKTRGCQVCICERALGTPDEEAQQEESGATP